MSIFATLRKGAALRRKYVLALWDMWERGWNREGWGLGGGGGSGGVGLGGE